MNNKYDILIIKENDVFELPVHICDTIEEASQWLGCSPRTLYNTKHLTGSMCFNGYILELVKREV